MFQINREHRRIKKSLHLQFCLSDTSSKKWDMTIIENISAGGIRFTAPSDLKLFDKIIHLQIKIPELAPHLLELEAIVLSAKPRPNSDYCDVRAKFINLSATNKERLSVVEKMVDLQDDKEVPKLKWKKQNK